MICFKAIKNILILSFRVNYTANELNDLSETKLSHILLHINYQNQRFFKFFVNCTKEDRNSQSLTSSFYKIRFEAGKLELNTGTQIIIIQLN